VNPLYLNGQAKDANNTVHGFVFPSHCATSFEIINSFFLVSLVTQGRIHI